MQDIGMQPDYRSGVSESVECHVCHRTGPEELAERCPECGEMVCPECYVPDYELCQDCHAAAPDYNYHQMGGGFGVSNW